MIKKTHWRRRGGEIVKKKYKIKKVNTNFKKMFKEFNNKSRQIAED